MGMYPKPRDVIIDALRLKLPDELPLRFIDDTADAIIARLIENNMRITSE